MGCGATKEESSSKKDKKNKKDAADKDTANANANTSTPIANESKYKETQGESTKPVGKAALPTVASSNALKASTKGNLKDANTYDNEVAQAMLNQSMLVDLRQKNTKEQGSSVQRWVDSVAAPSETDNNDVYDPIRRHFLALESLLAAKEVAGAQSEM